MSTHANEYCYDTSEEKYPLIESIEKRHLTIDPPFVHSHCATLLRYFFPVKVLRIFSWLFRKRYPYVLVLAVLKNVPNFMICRSFHVSLFFIHLNDCNSNSPITIFQLFLSENIYFWIIWMGWTNYQWYIFYNPNWIIHQSNV